MFDVASSRGFRRAAWRCATAALRTSSLLLVAAAIVVGLLGCRSNPYDEAYVQTLHSEIRMLEDEIYAIESEYDKTLRLLEACDDRSAANGSGKLPAPSASNPLRDAMRKSMPSRSERISPEPELLPPSLGRGTPTPAGSSGSRSSGTTRSAPGELSEPMIDLGEVDPGFEGEILPQSYEETIDDAAREPYDGPTDTRVTHIVLNPRRTGGLDFNGAPGDDGLYVVVEPRNQNDAFVPLAGEMSLVLLDPREEPETARVARWDLSKSEIARRLRHDEPTAPGVHLKLPWNELPPSNEDLLLFVRYTTADGRKVEAQAALTIAAVGKTATRWTPRSPETPSGRNAGEYAVPPNLSAADGSPSAPVPTIADLRIQGADANWTAPKRLVAPAGAQSPVEADAKPKSAPKTPTWKPYR